MLYVAFVAYQEDTLSRNAFLQGFIEIVVATFDGRGIGKVEDADAALRAFVVGACQGSEFFLSSSVPDLETVLFGVDDGAIGFEVDADGGGVGVVEGRLAEAEKDGALSDCLGSHDDDFEGFILDV